MSATHRGGVVRLANDHYPSPPWSIDPVLPLLPVGGMILDAGCGAGAILSRVARVAPARAWLTGVELVPELAAEARARFAEDTRVRIVEGSYLDAHTLPNGVSFDCIVANPPFSLAEEFLARSRELVAPCNGTIAFLLRHDWAVPNTRADLIEKYKPDVHPLTRRPQFRVGAGGKKGSDSCEYAWLIWSPGRGGRWAPLRCPAAVRHKKKLPRDDPHFSKVQVQDAAAAGSQQSEGS